MSSSNGQKKNYNNGVINVMKQIMFPQKNVNVSSIASGKNGVVYKIAQNSSKMIKIVDGTRSSLSKEKQFSEIASDLGVGAKIYRSNIFEYNNNIYLALLMENLDGTLYDYLSRNDMTDDIYNQISFAVSLLNERGICHNDLHLKNIMYKRKNNSIEIKIIDFSRATDKIGACSRNRNKLNEYSRKIIKKVNTSPNYGFNIPKIALSNTNFMTPS